MPQPPSATLPFVIKLAVGREEGSVFGMSELKQRGLVGRKAPAPAGWV